MSLFPFSFQLDHDHPFTLSHSLCTFVYPRQGIWGWLLWYGQGRLALQLAWALPPNRPISKMQSVVCSWPGYANLQLVAVKRMKRKWEGWDECRKLKEFKVRANAPFFGPSLANDRFACTTNRHYWQYPLIQTSYPCMILFFFQSPRNSTSCLNQWRGTYINLSSLAMVVVLLLVVSSR
jgi:hypothetical protein